MVQTLLFFQVVLENAYADPTDGVSVRGVVRVLNMDFHKAVYIRWTLNDWRTMMDYKASYLAGSNDVVTDKFTFKIYAPLDLGESLIFAVRFHCVGDQFWDNNFGANFRFICTDQSEEEEQQPAEGASSSVGSKDEANGERQQQQQQQQQRQRRPLRPRAQLPEIWSSSSTSSNSSNSSGGLSSQSSLSSVTSFRVGFNRARYGGGGESLQEEDDSDDPGIVINL